MNVLSSLTRTTPNAEPVSLELAKRHLEVDVDDWDDWISAQITAARQKLESHTQRIFSDCTATATFEDFPRRECEWTSRLPAIRLPLLASAISSLGYIDASGNAQTLAANTDWLASLNRVPSLIYPTPGKVWPSVQYGRTDRVTVVFTPRIDDAEQGNAAILLMLGHWFKFRDGDGERGDADAAQTGLPLAALRIMNGLMRPMYI